MKFDEYQKESKKTAEYPDGIEPYVYISLGLAGEAGEVVEKVKKLIRNDNGVLTPDKRDEIVKEMGDLLWYLTQLATQFDVSLDDVAKKNLEKLISRKARGVIKSEGDNR